LWKLQIALFSLKQEVNSATKTKDGGGDVESFEERGDSNLGDWIDQSVV
jgi:hypothetical protein